MTTTQTTGSESSSRHWIATRRTAQGTIVHLWPDGAITWALGRYIKGSACPRTDAQRSVALCAGWLVMGDVELYDDTEVPALISAARWTAARSGDPAMMRARLHARAPMRPMWTTLEADRDGRPRVQCWRLPRPRWPGLAVFRESGAYSVWSEIGHSGSFSPTGMSFTNLKSLSEYLYSIPIQ